jgi:arylsulfatase
MHRAESISRNVLARSITIVVCQWYPHDESIRVPLIIQDPRMPDHLRGTLNDEFTLNLDLAPTLLGAAGVPVPKHMQGRDIADLYLGDYQTNRKEWRKDFFYEWSQGRAEDAEGHESEDSIPAVFALVRKDYKVRQ